MDVRHAYECCTSGKGDEGYEDRYRLLTEGEAFYRRFVREHLPERRTQEIIADLKPLQMLGEPEAIARGVLFAESAVKAEGRDATTSG